MQNIVIQEREIGTKIKGEFTARTVLLDGKTALEVQGLSGYIVEEVERRVLADKITTREGVLGLLAQIALEKMAA